MSCSSEDDPSENVIPQLNALVAMAFGAAAGRRYSYGIRRRAHRAMAGVMCSNDNSRPLAGSSRPCSSSSWSISPATEPPTCCSPRPPRAERRLTRASPDFRDALRRTPEQRVTDGGLATRAGPDRGRQTLSGDVGGSQRALGSRALRSDGVPNTHASVGSGVISLALALPERSVVVAR